MSRQWQAKLTCTAFTPAQFPKEVSLPEVAFVGRSNVGKSSLINALINQKLAHVSSKPGKTRSINFFDVSCEHPFVLVDLPGFGYAAASKEEKKTWGPLIETYINTRENLVLVVHLIDIRHGPLAKDKSLQDWMKQSDVPVLSVFTKADKIAKTKRKAMALDYVKKGLLSWTLPVVTSVEEAATIQDLRVQLEDFVSRVVPNPEVEG